MLLLRCFYKLTAWPVTPLPAHIAPLVHLAEFDEIPDWHTVFNVAIKSKDHKDFYFTLQKLGLVARWVRQRGRAAGEGGLLLGGVWGCIGRYIRGVERASDEIGVVRCKEVTHDPHSLHMLHVKEVQQAVIAVDNPRCLAALALRTMPQGVYFG